MKKWLDKYELASAEHEPDLERMAAVHEFGGLSKEDAEHFSYERYKELQHAKAAAYHLDGLDQAKHRGDKDAVKSHFAMYCLHSKALGINPHNEVSPKIQGFRNQHKPEKFEAHEADKFALAK